MDSQRFEALVAQTSDPDDEIQGLAWEALAESLDPRAIAYVLNSADRMAAEPDAFAVGLGELEDIFIQSAPRSIAPLLVYFETGDPTSAAMSLVARSLGEIAYHAGDQQDPRILPATVKAIERWRTTSIESIESFLITLKNCMFVRPTRPHLDPLLLSLTEQALAEGRQAGTFLIDIMNRNQTPGLQALARQLMQRFGIESKNLWISSIRNANPPVL